MNTKALIIASALLIAAPASAGTIWVANDPGGYLPDYAYKYSRAAVDGDRVVISGSCGSACTLALYYLPSSRVCAMPGARLQFHQASGREGTAWLQRHYPSALMRWINAQGGLTARVLTLQGPMLNQFVRPCDTAVASR